ncbi:MAG TPA: hypothetical protein VHJ20_18885 [Polyangia bacterium]|nr:hypothetical protein [Polyangia bacterium]
MVVVLSLAAVAPAHAEDAEELIRQGVALRRAGKDGAAFGYFERAYQVAHTPRSAAQLGLVELALDRAPDAETHLTEALATNDPWVEQNHASLETARTNARKKLARVELVGAPSGARVTVGARTLDVPADGVVWIAPSAVAISISVAAADGRTVEVKVASVSAGASTRVEVQMPPPVPAAPPPAPVESATSPTPSEPAEAATPNDGGKRARRIAGIVTGAAGVALGVAGVVVYEAGSSKLDAIKKDAANHKPYDTANGNYQTLGDAGIALIAVGGAAVATGVVLYVLNRDAEPAAEPRVAFGYVPGGGVLQIGGRF